MSGPNSMRPGSRPDKLKSLDDIRRFPFTTKADMRDTYPFGLFAVPREQVVRLHASSGTTGKATVVGYTRARHRPLDRPDGALHRLRRRAAGRHRAQRLRLRPVHRRARRALRRRAARLHRRAGVRRHDRAAGHAAAGFRRPRAVRNALLCAQHRRGRRGHGRRSPQAAGERRNFRRRALERCAAPRARRAARHRGGRSLWPVRDHRAGRRLRMQRGAQRPARLGGSFPVRGDRSEDARAGRARRARRTGHHHADQGSAADGPLPLARHHALEPRALRLRPHATSASCASPAATTT